VNKLIVGGALGALLIAGQAIASRLPEAPTARAADPKGAESVTTEPGVTPTARAIDRLDPVTTLDPSGAAPVGPLTEAETARLAAQVPAGFEQSSIQISAPFSPPDEVCNGIDDDRDGLVDEGCGLQDVAYAGPQPTNIVPIVATAVIATTAIVVATDDDSDS
jgi:hypothetical protein